MFTVFTCAYFIFILDLTMCVACQLSIEFPQADKFKCSELKGQDFISGKSFLASDFLKMYPNPKMY